MRIWSFDVCSLAQYQVINIIIIINKKNSN